MPIYYNFYVLMQVFNRKRKEWPSDKRRQGDMRPPGDQRNEAR